MNDAFRRQFQRVLPLCGSYGRASNDGETVAAGQQGTTRAAEGKTVAAGRPGTTTAVPLTAMQTVKTVDASDKPTTPPVSKPY